MVRLRDIRNSDIQKIIDWNKNKDAEFLWQWSGNRVYHAPLTYEQVEDQCRKCDSRIFMIESDGKVVGTIELAQIDQNNHATCISRYLICDSEKGHGIGTQAIQEVVRIGKEEMNLTRFILHVYCYNVSAIRCYEKAGFCVKSFHETEDKIHNFYTMELR